MEAYNERHEGGTRWRMREGSIKMQRERERDGASRSLNRTLSLANSFS